MIGPRVRFKGRSPFPQIHLESSKPELIQRGSAGPVARAGKGEALVFGDQQLSETCSVGSGGGLGSLKAKALKWANTRPSGSR